MFYFILAAVVFVALVLIFRDDHDRRYDQRSGGERQYHAEKQAPRQAQASAPRPEPRIRAARGVKSVMVRMYSAHSFTLLFISNALPCKSV